MDNYLNAKELKEQASIVELLAKLGFQPAKKTGKELLYVSMLRDSDTKPSMSVNDNIGMWYDHGTGKGGNIIDFGLEFWKHLNFNEVVAKIQDCVAVQPSSRTLRPRKAVKIPHYIVEEVKNLGTHPAITDYLKGRGIFDVAFGKMQEVYYFVEDHKGEKKQFFAAGWKNENGSWEVRNKYFKGCLGHKAMSIIPGDTKKLAVFEGFTNYLSWKLEYPTALHTVIVVNSLSLIKLAIERAKAYSSIDLFMDRDQPGLAATKEFIKSLPYATDRSPAYNGFNDYNDKIVAGMQCLPAELENTEKRKSAYTV